MAVASGLPEDLPCPCPMEKPGRLCCLTTSCAPWDKPPPFTRVSVAFPEMREFTLGSRVLHKRCDMEWVAATVVDDSMSPTRGILDP